MFNLLGSIAEFERSPLLGRQSVGIAKAKAEEKLKGLKEPARAKSDKIQEFLSTGMNPSSIAEQLNIGLAYSCMYRK